MARYRARPYSEWSRRERQRGVAIVETAIILPLLALLLAGGLGLGLAIVADVRIEHAASQAVNLAEDDAAALIESAGGTMTCYWSGTGPGDCYHDGIEVDRVQVAAETSLMVPFLGEVRPSASATGVPS